jgi:hypothetical protein
VASDGASGDRFGYAVAAGSGTVLVGAYQAGGPGAAYVFMQGGGAWTQAQKLVPADPTGTDYFGASVALSGNTAVVGAYEHGGATGSGAAYVFTNGAAGWQAPQELVGPTGGQLFGYSVAVSGATVAVGAFGASNDSGAAYLFATAPPAVPVLGSGAPVLMILVLGAVGSLAMRRRRGGHAS